MISRTLSYIGAAALTLAVAAAGCSKESKPTAEQPRAAGDKPAAEVTPAAVTATGDKAGAAEPAGGELGEATGNEADALKSARADYKETNFTLSIKPKGDYKAGQAGEAEIVLESKAPFHVNDKYPYKFKLADTAGVEYPDKIVKKDKVKLEQMKATMAVPFTPKEAGKKKVSGVFHFSVCTDDKCLIEKRGLAVDVDVK